MIHNSLDRPTFQHTRMSPLLLRKLSSRDVLNHIESWPLYTSYMIFCGMWFAASIDNNTRVSYVLTLWNLSMGFHSFWGWSSSPNAKDLLQRVQTCRPQRPLSIACYRWWVVVTLKNFLDGFQRNSSAVHGFRGRYEGLMYKRPHTRQLSLMLRWVISRNSAKRA
jgi:hypothetical protein